MLIINWVFHRSCLWEVDHTDPGVWSPPGKLYICHCCNSLRLFGGNCWAASLARKYFAAFQVFVITTLWLSSILTKEGRIQTEQDTEFDNKVARSVSALAQASRPQQFVHKREKQAMGVVAGEEGRHLPLQFGKMTVCGCCLCKRDNLVLPMMPVEVCWHHTEMLKSVCSPQLPFNHPLR